MVPGATPSAPHMTELSVKKSVFLAHASHCSGSKASREFIAKIKASHPDATHNCWAFSSLAPGNAGESASSDDGEPHGTAGRPILQCLSGSGLGEICMVVSRWFGGIKLGVGGLAKAYQQAALENLATLPKVWKISYVDWLLTVDYSYLEAVKRYLADLEAKIDSEEYTDKARLKLGVPEDRDDGFTLAIQGLCNGNAQITSLKNFNKGS